MLIGSTREYRPVDALPFGHFVMVIPSLGVTSERVGESRHSSMRLGTTRRTPRCKNRDVALSRICTVMQRTVFVMGQILDSGSSYEHSRFTRTIQMSWRRAVEPFTIFVETMARSGV
jgi:hypothetical protein